MNTRPRKGEAPVEIDGQTYTLAYGMPALLKASSTLGKHLPAIMAEMTAGPSLKTVRALFWAGLDRHHADVTLDAAGRLVAALGPVEALWAIERAMMQGRG